MKRGVRSPCFDLAATCNPRVGNYRALHETSAAKNGVIDDQEDYCAYHCHEQAVDIQPSHARRSKQIKQVTADDCADDS